MRKSEQSLIGLQDIITRTNKELMGDPERGERKGQRVFEEVMEEGAPGWLSQ